MQVDEPLVPDEIVPPAPQVLLETQLPLPTGVELEDARIYTGDGFDGYKPATVSSPTVQISSGGERQDRLPVPVAAQLENASLLPPRVLDKYLAPPQAYSTRFMPEHMYDHMRAQAIGAHNAHVPVHAVCFSFYLFLYRL